MLRLWSVQPFSVHISSKAVAKVQREALEAMLARVEGFSPVLVALLVLVCSFYVCTYVSLRQIRSDEKIS